MTGLGLALMVAGLVFYVLPSPQKSPQELVPVGAFAGRKNIYDRHLQELAVSLKLTSIYARPLEIREPEMIAARLASILGQEERELLNALRSERSFVWLGRRLEAEKAAQISELKAQGLYFQEEEQRFYPRRQAAAHVLGFLNEEQGLAGIEYYYDHLLQQGEGHEPPAVRPVSIESPGESAHLVLTLDLQLQALLERRLEEIKKDTEADSAMALVMAPATGEILALVNLPAYDPNRFWKYDAAARQNRVLSAPVYPGGLRGLFQLAAALAEGHDLAVFDQDSELTPVMTPRRQKQSTEKMKTEALHADWVDWEEGGYVSRGAGNLAGLPFQDLTWSQLAARLGLTGEISIDLPPENGPESPENTADSATALQLLAAFNQLVAEETLTAPHLLKALYGPSGGQEPISYDSLPPVVSRPVRQSVQETIQEAGIAVGDMILLEALTAKAPEEKKTAEPQPEPEPESRLAVFQDVLLGATREAEPQVTFLLVVDNARINLARASTLRAFGRRLATKLSRWQQDKAVIPAESEEKPPAAVYEKWREVHGPSERTAPQKGAKQTDLMPDVRGYGLRKALQMLQPYGLRIEVSGSGRVTGQQPGAGKVLAGVEEIKLELQASK